MKRRRGWTALAAAAVVGSTAYAINAPSSSDGPVKLLACVVTAGTLEADVNSQSDSAMSCVVRCSYELGEKMFSHTFTVTVPARFQGRVGRFNTSNARAGSYPGEIGKCTKVTR